MIKSLTELRFLLWIYQFYVGQRNVQVGYTVVLGGIPVFLGRYSISKAPVLI